MGKIRLLLCAFSALVAAGFGCAGSPCDNGFVKQGGSCRSTAECCYNHETAMREPKAILTCDVSTKTCLGSVNGREGAACTSNVQCESGMCDGNGHFCTKECSSSRRCEGTRTECTFYAFDGWRCRPRCGADTCALYMIWGETTAQSCKPAMRLGGGTAAVCLP